MTARTIESNLACDARWAVQHLEDLVARHGLRLTVDPVRVGSERWGRIAVANGQGVAIGEVYSRADHAWRPADGVLRQVRAGSSRYLAVLRLLQKLEASGLVTAGSVSAFVRELPADQLRDPRALEAATA